MGGIERLFSIMEAKAKTAPGPVRTTQTDVYVASAQKNLLEERMKLCNMLWQADVKTEQSYKKNPKMLNQLQYCEDNGIPLAVVLGESEIAGGVVKLRDIITRAEVEVKRDDMVGAIK